MHPAQIFVPLHALLQRLLGVPDPDPATHCPFEQTLLILKHPEQLYPEQSELLIHEVAFADGDRFMKIKDKNNIIDKQ